MSKTISQILNQYSGFEKAFWASYSISFTTLDFLLKKDFNHIMDPNYLHLICDINQLNESIEKISNDSKKMKVLFKLQEYCTISPQYSEGSFHPKILLLASADKLLFVVSSANATPSGILSNQDLIATFYFDSNNQEDVDTISSLYEYMRGFDGWGEEASEDLKLIGESFDFLQDNISLDNVITIPNDTNTPLFTQIVKGLPASDLKNINIFSPFFDDNYSAISKFEEHFKVPVNVFSPQNRFLTSRRDAFSKTKFFSTTKQRINNFHAKFYEFVYNDKSVVYWGSANCSYSGLLSSDRNYEFLIKCFMDKPEVEALWGVLDTNDPSSVEYSVTKHCENTSATYHDVYINSISMNMETLDIKFNKSLGGDFTLRGISSNGDVVYLKIVDKNGSNIEARCDVNDLVIVYVEISNKRVSNFIYVNNPFVLQARLSGVRDIPIITPDRKDTEIITIFGYFNIFNKNKTKNIASVLSSKRGFWTLPKFKKKSSLTRRVNLDSFINRRIIRLKENGIDAGSTNRGSDKNRNKTSIVSQNIINSINKEIGVLLKNIKEIVKNKQLSKIDHTKWLHGLDALNLCVLTLLENDEEIPVGLDNILLNMAKISSWFIYNLPDATKVSNESLELIVSIQDIFIGLSVYRLLLVQRFGAPIDVLNRDKEYINTIKRSIYYKYIILNNFSQLQVVSEFSRLTYNEVLLKLPNRIVATKTIEVLNSNGFSKLIGLDSVKIVSTKSGLMLFLLKNNFLNFEDILEKSASYQLDAKINYTDVIS